MDTRMLLDIAGNAIERNRKTTLLSTQLLEDDKDTALVMTLIAADHFNGAVQYLTDDDMTEENARRKILEYFFQAVGVDDLIKAIRPKGKKR